MSLMNLATIFGPSLLRPPVVGLGHNVPAVDISQEVVVQVGGVIVRFHPSIHPAVLFRLSSSYSINILEQIKYYLGYIKLSAEFFCAIKHLAWCYRASSENTILLKK